MLMLRSRFGSALIAVNFAVAGCNSTSSTEPKAGAEKITRTTLILGVNKKRLVSRLNPPKELRIVRVSNGEVDWYSPQSSGISIHLYPSLPSAAHYYRRSSRLRSTFKPSGEPKGVGDQLLCFGRTHNPDSSGLIFMRRWNVIVETRWEGDDKSAAAFVKKLDDLILNDATTFPRTETLTATSS